VTPTVRNPATERPIAALERAAVEKSDARTPLGEMRQLGFGRELGMAATDGYCDITNDFISTEG
jgi:hypothetical protein